MRRDEMRHNIGGDDKFHPPPPFFRRKGSQSGTEAPAVLNSQNEISSRVKGFLSMSVVVVVISNA